jgi:hypothetical protein
MYGTLTSPDPTATLALEDILPGYLHRDHDARRTAPDRARGESR